MLDIKLDLSCVLKLVEYKLWQALRVTGMIVPWKFDYSLHCDHLTKS